MGLGGYSRMQCLTEETRSTTLSLFRVPLNVMVSSKIFNHPRNKRCEACAVAGEIGAERQMPVVATGVCVPQGACSAPRHVRLPLLCGRAGWDLDRNVAARAELPNGRTRRDPQE